MEKKEQIRLVIALVLSAVVIFGWQYIMAPSAEQQAEIARKAAEAEQKTAALTEQPSTAAQAGAEAASAPDFTPTAGTPVTVDTPLYTAVFNSQGGTLEKFILKNYRDTIAANSPNVDLVGPNAFAKGPLGLILTANDKEHHTWKRGQWSFSGTDLTLNDSDGTKTLTFVGQSGGFHIERTLTFHADSYLIDESATVTNMTETGAEGSLSFTAAAKSMSAEDDRYNPTRIAYLTKEKREEMDDRDDLKEEGLSVTGELNWGAIESNYFLFAVLPGNENSSLSAGVQDDIFRMAISEKATFLPNVAKTLKASYFIGSTDREMLAKMPNDLSDAVNFGWFDVLAKPLLIGLNFFYDYIGNYGVAIILLTCIIKLIFWPLSQKSYGSMEQMKKLQPMVAKLREKYGDDKQRLNQETMALYKTYKVNPMGGCLPMIVQIPVFFGLYKALLGAVELRHAPFIAHLPFTDLPWLADLSAKDPYYITPIIMGASMFLQQKMTPSAGDPTQQKIMLLMPAIFTFMFLQFPSGLVVYWLFNNLLSIGQQLMIARKSKAKAAATND
ncbi:MULTISPECIES: membrane protein insertase YidC [unclassified Pseudodesulfovibrio]|uniref:membrane protein insertase YidC n=1 Tax=unclassified Pseudodesulfovibrio TaxID=2661612 RepID=UPI000FEB893E|nr:MULTISPECIES: membrane protein insertase YidC [unclassified Pseudodesulfovibrio]MCJ2165784.1 membrane protein insertase YidC [Pseudodesulfovibrio sp. S3-i]RWU02779.1 membrane protein insertase YidC [Pseudodesulfovibrio sp. S3]